MQFSTIASGSSGNCLYAANDDTHILIDAGISKKRIVQGLKSFGTDVLILMHFLLPMNIWIISRESVSGQESIMCRFMGQEEHWKKYGGRSHLARWMNPFFM